jgi:hypothetical protein
VRRVLAASLVLLSLTGCIQQGREDPVTAGKLDDLALARSLSSREFSSTVDVGGDQVTISGVVEDDYRYAASVRVGGQLAYEEVVADDRRYVRVQDATALLPAAVLPSLSANRNVAAVLSGRWVVDPFGAPEEFTAGRTVTEVPLSPRLVLERVRYLENLPETLKGGFREYNTDAIYYLPKDDKFPAHEEDGERYDRLPAAYDTTATTVTVDDLRKFFEYVSVWATEDGLTRLERLLELPDLDDDRYEEVYGQIERAGSGRLRALLARGKRGRTLTETYLARPATTGRTVVEPTGATRVDLVAAVDAIRSAVQALQTPSPLYGPIT